MTCFESNVRWYAAGGRPFNFFREWFRSNLNIQAGIELEPRGDNHGIEVLILFSLVADIPNVCSYTLRNKPRKFIYIDNRFRKKDALIKALNQEMVGNRFESHLIQSMPIHSPPYRVLSALLILKVQADLKQNRRMGLDDLGKNAKRLLVSCGY